MKSRCPAVADDIRGESGLQPKRGFTPATWAEGASIRANIVASHPSVIDRNQIGSGTTSIGAPAHARLGRDWVARKDATLNPATASRARRGFYPSTRKRQRQMAGLARVPLDRMIVFARVQRARRPRADLANTGHATICHIYLARLRLAHTCVLMCGSGQTVFVTESSVKAEPSTGSADGFLSLGTIPQDDSFGARRAG